MVSTFNSTPWRQNKVLVRQTQVRTLKSLFLCLYVCLRSCVCIYACMCMYVSTQFATNAILWADDLFCYSKFNSEGPAPILSIWTLTPTSSVQSPIIGRYMPQCDPRTAPHGFPAIREHRLFAQSLRTVFINSYWRATSCGTTSTRGYGVRHPRSLTSMAPSLWPVTVQVLTVTVTVTDCLLKHELQKTEAERRGYIYIYMYIYIYTHTYMQNAASDKRILVTACKYNRNNCLFATVTVIHNSAMDTAVTVTVYRYSCNCNLICSIAT